MKGQIMRYLNFCNDGHVYLAVDSRHDSFELSLMDSKVEEIERDSRMSLSICSGS